MTKILRRILRRHGPSIVAVESGDAHEANPLLQSAPEDVERWNDEWLAYLGREWPYQLTPYTEFRDKPPLPEDPDDLLDLSVGLGWKLGLYCDRDALEGRRVMELGCGCGNLGKQIARYVESYLGADFSTMALQVARLVSPPNCTYIHVADRKGLGYYHGYIDTVISRHFWIHQNLQIARRNLEFLELFLRPGGRLYADFFWPDPRAEQFAILKPDEPLSRTYPSAMFQYTSEDVQRLIADRPFHILRDAVSRRMQRRYVVLERLES